MTVCRACNKSYKVLIGVDDRYMDAEEIDEETVYCPFCGEDHRYHQQSLEFERDVLDLQ